MARCAHVCVVAGVRPGRRMRRQVRQQWKMMYVVDQLQQVCVRIDEQGAITPSEEVSASAIAVVNAARVAARYTLHEATERYTVDTQNEMYGVWRPAIGVDQRVRTP